jgi:hypothetical protein
MDAVLGELTTLLYGYNYAVFLRQYSVPYSPDAGVEQYVAQALGAAAIVGGSRPVTGTEVRAEVEEDLRHAGDRAYGPLPEALRSPRFEELLRTLLSHIELATARATLIQAFWLKEGHPAYPVFWDFAFVIAGPCHTDVLIGSSSD